MLTIFKVNKNYASMEVAEATLIQLRCLGFFIRSFEYISHIPLLFCAYFEHRFSRQMNLDSPNV